MFDEDNYSGEFSTEVICPAVNISLFGKLTNEVVTRKCAWTSENERKEKILKMIKNYRETKPRVLICSICDESGTWHRLSKSNFIMFNREGRFIDEIDHESEKSSIQVLFPFSFFNNKPVDRYELSGKFTADISYETGKINLAFTPDKDSVNVTSVRVKIYTPRIKKP